MQSVVGIFSSRAAAERAIRELVSAGIPHESLIFLTGEHSEAELASVPTTDAEAPGMGKTVGALLGGAAGVGAGLSLGSAVASLFVPGVGPILAAGLGAAAALGLGGAAVGASAGDATEHAMDEGVPKDDVLLYRDLLKQRRSLVIANVESDKHAEIVRSVLGHNGAQDADSAHKEWQRTRPGADLPRAS